MQVQADSDWYQEILVLKEPGHQQPWYWPGVSQNVPDLAPDQWFDTIPLLVIDGLSLMEFSMCEQAFY